MTVGTCERLTGGNKTNECPEERQLRYVRIVIEGGEHEQSSQEEADDPRDGQGRREPPAAQHVEAAA
jgi:hypothetical protein